MRIPLWVGAVCKEKKGKMVPLGYQVSDMIHLILSHQSEDPV